MLNQAFMGVIVMGRKPVPEENRKIFVGIRLPNWLLTLIKKDGTPQEVIEAKLTKMYEKKKRG